RAGPAALRRGTRGLDGRRPPRPALPAHCQRHPAPVGRGRSPRPRGGISGAFYLVWWDARRRLAESELATLGAVGQQTGILLRNARLLGETERRRLEAEELSRVLRSLTESLDVATVGERTVESVMRIFGAESA